jgi:hypothetical protein
MSSRSVRVHGLFRTLAQGIAPTSKEYEYYFIQDYQMTLTKKSRDLFRFTINPATVKSWEIFHYWVRDLKTIFYPTVFNYRIGQRASPSFVIPDRRIGQRASPSFVIPDRRIDLRN